MRKETILYLPRDGKEKWTKIMEGKLPELAEGILEGQPIVMATATFEDGFWVTGGVYKSVEPEAYNIKFMNVYTPDGQQIPFRIAPSDHEDFRDDSFVFYLNDEEVGDEYIVKVAEREEEWVFDKPWGLINL